MQRSTPQLLHREWGWGGFLYSDDDAIPADGSDGRRRFGLSHREAMIKPPAATRMIVAPGCKDKCDRIACQPNFKYKSIQQAFP